MSTTPKYPAKYPWHKWLKLNTTHTLEKGKHFQCTARTMAVYIYTRAKKEGVKVHVREVRNGVLQISAYRPNKAA